MTHDWSSFHWFSVIWAWADGFSIYTFSTRSKLGENRIAAYLASSVITGHPNPAIISSPAFLGMQEVHQGYWGLALAISWSWVSTFDMDILKKKSLWSICRSSWFIILGKVYQTNKKHEINLFFSMIYILIIWYPCKTHQIGNLGVHYSCGDLTALKFSRSTPQHTVREFQISDKNLITDMQHAWF